MIKMANIQSCCWIAQPLEHVPTDIKIIFKIHIFKFETNSLKSNFPVSYLHFVNETFKQQQIQRCSQTITSLAH